MFNLLTLTSTVNFLALAISLWPGFFSSPPGGEPGHKRRKVEVKPLTSG